MLRGLGCLPNLIEDVSRKRCLILREEAAIMLGHHLRGILDGIAGLLIRASLLENMGCQHIADVMRPIR